MSYFAELVTTVTRDGYTLSGSLRRPAAGSAGETGLDVVILHHGIGGKFYGSTMFDRISEYWLEAGTAVLRVNNRGSDLIANGQKDGRPVRVGAALETVADCVPDYQAWNEFAVAQGFQKIGMWGHSLGAVKTIYFLATEGDRRVVCAVASSPPRFAFNAYLSGPEPEAAEFRAQYEQARALVDQGKGRTLLDVTRPTGAVVSAATYVDKYGPADRYDIVRYLPKVDLPMLVTVGGLEASGPQRMSFAGHEAAIGPLAAAHAGLSFHIVPEADHFYTRCEEALWTAVRSWVAGAISSSPAAGAGVANPV